MICKITGNYVSQVLAVKHGVGKHITFRLLFETQIAFPKRCWPEDPSILIKLPPEMAPLSTRF